ncbi:hypothetical protein DSC45_13595 [Streptomyces sp. YIM 130001]|uniref:DUF5133 domain-containing protein n=1 Tax=Streptomyces sp. YIM 130001 TaxID=2259644 RepID=UPI000E6483D2|nr:DUF5133 domain-containing protein [Streptomyces sp. YIM 130001]RII17933.1 hypothetical protein DSC45_13595 [Streptomyces sp. YIM 130001]
MLAATTVLRRLVEQYETLQQRKPDSANPSADQQLDDVTYTLCVITGTREVEAALAIARRALAVVDGQMEDPPTA